MWTQFLLKLNTEPHIHYFIWLGDWKAGPSYWLFCNSFWTMICCCAAVKNSEFKIALETRMVVAVVAAFTCRSHSIEEDFFCSGPWSLQLNANNRHPSTFGTYQLLRILYNNQPCSKPMGLQKKSWQPIHNSTFPDDVCKLPKHGHSCQPQSQRTRICQELPIQDMSVY